MNKNDTLFRIIKSLSATEKKYFKQHAAKYTDAKAKSSYENLFDAYNSWQLDKYDEAVFKKKHADKSFIKNFAYEKHYLQSLILKVMRALHASGRPQTAFFENLIDFYFLAQKGIISLAQEALNHAHDHAEKIENIENQLLLEILNMGLRNGLSKNPDKDFELTQTLIEKLRIERRAFYIGEKVLNLTKNKGNAVIGKLATEAQTLLKSKHITLKAEKSLTYTLLDYYTSNEQYQKAFKVAKNLIRKMDSSPKSSYYTGMWLRGALYNFMEAASYAKKWSELKKGLDRLKNMGANDAIIAADQFVFVSINELKYRIGKRSYNDTKELLNSIHDGLKKYESIITDSYRFLLEIHLVHFAYATKRYDECIQYLSNAQGYAGRDCANHLLVLEFKSLEILCLAHNEIYAPIESRLLNLKRYIKEKKVNDAFALQLIATIEQITKTKSINSKSVRSSFKLLKETKCIPEFNMLKLILQ